MNAVPPVVVARFWSKVEMTGGCWIWTAGRSGEGYGTFAINRRPLLAHRVAYELLVGPIPDGLHIDHLCRVRHCVKPAHMEPVPCRTNLLRGIGPSAINARKTHCHVGHEFTPENTKIDGKDKRACRECRRISDRKRRAYRTDTAHSNGTATHCRRGHEFSAENTYTRANGRRLCRACVRIRTQSQSAVA